MSENVVRAQWREDEKEGRGASTRGKVEGW